MKDKDKVGVPAPGPGDDPLKHGLAQLGLELAGIDERLPDGVYVVETVRLQALCGEHGSVVYAPIRFQCRVRLNSHGVVELLDSGAACEAAKADAQAWLSMLIANRLLAPEGETLAPGATHRIVTDSEGRLVVMRARFSRGFG